MFLGSEGFKMVCEDFASPAYFHLIIPVILRFSLANGPVDEPA